MKMTQTITKGMKVEYNGFGSDVGQVYTVVRTNDKLTLLDGLVYGKPSQFNIRTPDLENAIISGDYIVKP